MGRCVGEGGILCTLHAMERWSEVERRWVGSKTALTSSSSTCNDKTKSYQLDRQDPGQWGSLTDTLNIQLRQHRECRWLVKQA
jgi:hypothetical protein